MIERIKCTIKRRHDLGHFKVSKHYQLTLTNIFFNTMNCRVCLPKYHSGSSEPVVQLAFVLVDVSLSIAILYHTT